MQENKQVITIYNVEKPEKMGTLVARFDAYLAPWDYEFRGCCYFEKGANAWCTSPTTSYEKDGEKIYKEMGGFRDPKKNKRFGDQMKAAFKKYRESNPSLEPEPAVTFDDSDCPF